MQTGSELYGYVATLTGSTLTLSSGGVTTSYTYDDAVQARRVFERIKVAYLTWSIS